MEAIKCQDLAIRFAKSMTEAEKVMKDNIIDDKWLMTMMFTKPDELLLHFKFILAPPNADSTDVETSRT